MPKKTGLTAKAKKEAVLRLLRREEPAAKIARRCGISEQTLYRYRDAFLEAGQAGLNGAVPGKAERERIAQLDRDILPVIPLKQPAPAHHPTRKDVALSRRGVPTCEGGAEMVAWAKRGKQGVVYVCPVKAGQLDRCPQAPPEFPRYRCRPLEKLAPTVTIQLKDNPRLCPPLPRNHRRFKQLMKLRSGSERSFSMKKQRFGLEQARHRRQSFWLIRLHLIAVLQHALAWVVAEEPAEDFVDRLLCREERKVA